MASISQISDILNSYLKWFHVWGTTQEKEASPLIFKPRYNHNDISGNELQGRSETKVCWCWHGRVYLSEFFVSNRILLWKKEELREKISREEEERSRYTRWYSSFTNKQDDHTTQLKQEITPCTIKQSKSKHQKTQPVQTRNSGITANSTDQL